MKLVDWHQILCYRARRQESSHTANTRLLCTSIALGTITTTVAMRSRGTAAADSSDAASPLPAAAQAQPLADGTGGDALRETAPRADHADTTVSLARSGVDTELARRAKWHHIVKLAAANWALWLLVLACLEPLLLARRIQLNTGLVVVPSPSGVAAAWLDAAGYATLYSILAAVVAAGAYTLGARHATATTILSVFHVLGGVVFCADLLL